MITLLYSGNVGIGQDIATVLHAAARLNCSGNLRIVIVGGGRELSAIRGLASQLQLRHTEFREPVPLSDLRGLLADGDIHLIFQKPGTEGLLVPSKIYSTLAAGRPSLFVGPPNCEVSRIIRDSRSGFVVDPGDIEGAMQALSNLAESAPLRQQMGQNARQYYENHFGRQQSVSRIIGILERVARPRELTATMEEPNAHGIPQSERWAEVQSMTGARRGRRSAVAAMLVATVIMSFFGTAYYAVAARLDGPATAAPLPADSLAALPLQMADWIGHDVPMDEDVVRRTDTDAHISRQYLRRDGSGSVTLFFGCSFSAFDRTFHRPEVCYPLAGWTLVRDRSVNLHLSDGNSLPCTVFQFHRDPDELQSEDATVLHYYIADGQPYANVSLVAPRLWRLGGRTDYLARVLVVASARDLPADSAEKTVSDFAMDSAPFIDRLLENLKSRQASGGFCNPPGAR